MDNLFVSAFICRKAAGRKNICNNSKNLSTFAKRNIYVKEIKHLSEKDIFYIVI